MPTIVTKTVNIKANIPVRDVTPPIYGVRNGIKMTLGDILKCLCKRAIIDEVLSDGSTVRLNTKNFRLDFEAELQKKIAAEKKAEEDAKANLTGSIDEVNFVNDIDDDDDDNDNEPEEAKNVIVVDEDGNESIGVDPTDIDDEDDAEDEAVEEDNEEVIEEEEAESSNQVTTISGQSNYNPNVTRKNSSKKKKKR